MFKLIVFIARKHNEHWGVNIKPADIDSLTAVFTTHSGSGYFYSTGGEYFIFKNGRITKHSPVLV